MSAPPVQTHEIDIVTHRMPHISSILYGFKMYWCWPEVVSIGITSYWGEMIRMAMSPTTSRCVLCACVSPYVPANAVWLISGIYSEITEVKTIQSVSGSLSGCTERRAAKIKIENTVLLVGFWSQWAQSNPTSTWNFACHAWLYQPWQIPCWPNMPLSSG